MTRSIWKQTEDGWWLYDMAAAANETDVSERALPGHWQVADYVTESFEGNVLLANPSQNAPQIRISLPVSGRYSIAIGLLVNYCDRLLLKLERDSYFSKLSHSTVPPAAMAVEECWWKDVDLHEGDVLVLQQDNAMKRRCNVAFVHLREAAPATPSEFPLYVTVDGLPGNHGPVELDEMLNEELMFGDTHVTDILHGTDINGAAQYLTQLPEHRFPVEQAAEQRHTDDEYYPWTVEQLLKFEQAGRCPLRESVQAAHSIGRNIYAYYRMAVTRLYGPHKSLFFNPWFDTHPEWRCIDFDGTPVARLSIAYPEVRQYFLDHLRETVEYGADGVCLVFSRGWPLVLFEEPVAKEFKKRTGKDMHAVDQNDADLRQVRADCITQLVRDIKTTVQEAGAGREVKVVAMVLYSPDINHFFGMDCRTWTEEGLIQVLIPFPYNEVATPTPIDIEEWLPVVKGTSTQLCPTLNRTTYEPAGNFDTLSVLLERAEKWLEAGVDGLTIWDLDGIMALPTFRGLGYHIGSRDGRAFLRSQMGQGPRQYLLKKLDGQPVDRYRSGWNV